MSKSLLYKEESSLIFLGKEVDLVKSLFLKQRVYYQKSINIQQSFHLGHCATLYHEGLICQQKFALSCLQEGELSAKIDDVPS